MSYRTRLLAQIVFPGTTTLRLWHTTSCSSGTREVLSARVRLTQSSNWWKFPSTLTIILSGGSRLGGTTVIPGVDSTRRYFKTYISFSCRTLTLLNLRISLLYDKLNVYRFARYCSAAHCNFFDRRSFLISLIYWCFSLHFVPQMFLGWKIQVLPRGQNSNRYMDCLIEKLCSVFPGHVQEQGKTVQRWTLISHAYRNIRHKVLSNASLTRHTQLQLMEINQRTLFQWYVFKVFVLIHWRQFMWML